MPTSGIYVNFIPLIVVTTPVAGATISVDIVGSTPGSYELEFSGATATAGTTITLLDNNVPSSTVYTYTGLTTSDGDPVLSYPGLLGLTNYVVLSNSSPSLLSGLTLSANLNFACFVAGTRILTARGEVPVEDLVVGDLVPTLLGHRLAPIRWIGRRRVDCVMHARPWDVLPVRIAAGAFGAGAPQRDLLLSPDHAVHVDGVLIPVRYLTNDTTITQEDVPDITYFHIELDRHDVILAEGLPAETYLDTGNRAAFGHGAVTALYPDYRPVDRDAWDQRACARLVEHGPALEAVRQRLAARATELGHAPVEAHRIALSSTGYFVHVIPPHTSRVELVSDHLVPPGEHRRLGASISALSLDGVPIALDRPALAAGFHEVENRGHQLARWTNGCGVLVLPASEQVQFLEVGVELLVRPVLALAS